MTIVLVVIKNDYPIQWRILSFLGARVQSKNKQLFRQIFPYLNFLIKAFLLSTFNPQEVLKKWTGRHITEERAKNTQKMTKSYLCINL